MEFTEIAPPAPPSPTNKRKKGEPEGSPLSTYLYYQA